MKPKGHFKNGAFVEEDNGFRVKCVATIAPDGSVTSITQYLSHDSGVTWEKQ
jgi:hypothetical protein